MMAGGSETAAEGCWRLLDCRESGREAGASVTAAAAAPEARGSAAAPPLPPPDTRAPLRLPCLLKARDCSMAAAALSADPGGREAAASA